MVRLALLITDYLYDFSSIKPLAIGGRHSDEYKTTSGTALPGAAAAAAAQVVRCPYCCTSGFVYPSSCSWVKSC